MKEFIQKNQVLVSVLVVGLVWLIWIIRLPIAVLFLSYIISAAFLAPTNFLEKKGIPRIIAVLLLFFGIGGILVWVGYLLASPIISDVRNFASEIPKFTENLSGFGWYLRSIFDSIQSSLSDSILNITNSTLEIITFLITAIVSSIYLLYTWTSSHDFFFRHLPQKNKEKFQKTIKNIEISLGSWARGQLLLSVVVGSLVAISMYFAKVDYAPALGFFAGILEFIPYAGPIISIIPAILIAISFGTEKVVLVLVIYFAINEIENTLLVPMIMKNSVELHPTLIIFSIVAGYEVMGVIGALLATPFVATLFVILKTNLNQVKV